MFIIIIIFQESKSFLRAIPHTTNSADFQISFSRTAIWPTLAAKTVFPSSNKGIREKSTENECGVR